MNKLLIMDAQHGHLEVEFHPPEVKTKEAAVTRKRAEAIFNEIMSRRGWVVIAQLPAELEGVKMTKFDPSVEEAVAIGQVRGG